MGYEDLKPLPDTCPVKFLPTEYSNYQDHLYGPMGHYSRSITEAYTPIPNSHSPYYGRMMITFIKTEIFEPMLAGIILENDEPFVIEEHGSGDGRLLLDMLEYAKEMSLKHNDWKVFYDHLFFRGTDIAEPAYAELKKIEEKYPGKFKARLGDVLVQSETAPFKGVILSRLLIDSFPLHQIIRTDTGFGVVTSTPRFDFETESERELFVRTFFDDESVLERSADLQQSCFSDIYHRTSKHPLYLGTDDWRTLQRSAARFTCAEGCPEYLYEAAGEFDFVRAYAPSSHFPEVESYLKAVRHLPLYQWELIPSGETFRINTGMPAYLHLSSDQLTAGAVLTIDMFEDYGRTDAMVSKSDGSNELFERLDFNSFGTMILYRPLSEEVTDFLYPNSTRIPESALWQYYSAPDTSADDAKTDILEKNGDPRMPTLERSHNSILVINIGSFGPLAVQGGSLYFSGSQ